MTYSGESNIADRTGLNVPGYNIGEIGEIDLWREHAVITRYDQLTGDNTVAHAELTCRIVEDFLGTGVGPYVYSAAMLHRLALDVEDPIKGPVAAGLLRSYSETLPPEEWEKISRYLSDFQPLQKFADEKRRKADLLLPMKPLRSARKGQPSERQKSRLGRVNAEDMDIFLSSVNIESANIMAAATLATLMRPGFVSSDDEYHRILREADVVYGQITDFSSKDAFTMALRNNKKRFTDAYPRHAWVYDEVGNYMKGFGGRDQFSSYVSGILNRMFGRDSINELSIKGNTEHGIVYGMAAVKISTGGIAKVIYRGKSQEGAADKVMRSTERLGHKLKQSEGIPKMLLPPDVLGMTTVVQDMHELAVVYADILQVVSKKSMFAPGLDPTKSSPHSLDGSAQFIKEFNSVFEGYRWTGENGIVTKPNDRGFDALRTIFRHIINGPGSKVELPTDMHVQTVDGRTAARTGPANHGVYDLDKTKKHCTPSATLIAVNTEALLRMEKRAAHMGSGIFVPESGARSQYWRNRIAASQVQELFCAQ